MSNKRVAINGFGRIGRLTFRAFLEVGRKDLDFVAINDLGSAEMNAHLLDYDSVHGRFPGKITAAKGNLKADGHDVAVIAEANAGEASLARSRRRHRHGMHRPLHRPRRRGEASRRLAPSACSCPRLARKADFTVVYGVNDEKLTQEHHVVSNASCTTNCLAPVARCSTRRSASSTAI